MRIQRSRRVFADATVDETVCSRDKRAGSGASVGVSTVQLNLIINERLVSILSYLHVVFRFLERGDHPLDDSVDLTHAGQFRAKGSLACVLIDDGRLGAHLQLRETEDFIFVIIGHGSRSGLKGLCVVGAGDSWRGRVWWGVVIWYFISQERGLAGLAEFIE